jgi:hypothetical protein
MIAICLAFVSFVRKELDVQFRSLPDIIRKAVSRHPLVGFPLSSWQD